MVAGSEVVEGAGGRKQWNSGYVAGRRLTGFAEGNPGRHERDAHRKRGKVWSSVYTS